MMYPITNQIILEIGVNKFSSPSVLKYLNFFMKLSTNELVKFDETIRETPTPPKFDLRLINLDCLPNLRFGWFCDGLIRLLGFDQS